MSRPEGRPANGSEISLTRRASAGSLLEDVIFDLRFALRGLRRSPTLTVVAVVTVAVGMGATSAVMSIADGFLLRQPPVLEPGRMVSVWESRSGSVRDGAEGRLLPYERYEAYRQATTEVFEDLAGHAYAKFSIRMEAGAVTVDGFVTSGNYFRLLGLVPPLGRLYEADDEEVVVLSERLWRSRFGADREVVGRTISIESRTFTVAGVAPAGFVGTMAVFTGDLWVPRAAYVRLIGRPEAASHVVPIGRLRPGLERALAEERVDAVARSIPPLSSVTTVRGARLDPLAWRADLQEPVRLGMTIVLAAAALLLVIACANIAGMMLARSYERRREITVRLAIGAGRGRLVRQLLTESVLLALMGGAAGVGLGVLATSALASLDFPVDVTVTLDLAPDRGVLLASFVTAALVGIAFGIGPALHSARTDLATSLKEAGHGKTLGKRRGAFVVGQLAISTLLLVTAGLFVRSLDAMTSVPLGFDPDGVSVASVSLASHGYSEEEGRLFYDRLLERARALPGVESAGLGGFVFLRGSNASNDGRPVDGGEDAPEVSVSYNVVEPGFFEANRIELVAGRFFTDADAEGTSRVAVVNQTLAERMWPGQSALGRAFRSGGVEHEVVGVVRDGVYAFVYEPRRAFSFYPFAQQYRPGMSLHVRTAGPTGSVGGELREIVRDLDPEVALGEISAMEDVVAANGFGPRFLAWLTTTFAAVGLLLAAVGVYGLLSVQVARRGREFGVRMAVGAKHTDVLLLVLGRGATAAVTGCVLGVVLALGGGRLLAALLYQVSPYDAVTFALVPAVLIVTALLASAVPARRATRVSPAVTLREE